MDENGTYRWTPNEPPKPPKKNVKVPDFSKLGKNAIVVAIVFVLVLCSMT